MTDSDRPDLSVVVPSVNGPDILLRVLDALDRQQGDVRLEILVPERCGPTVRNAVATRFPHAILLPVPAEIGIPTMRRLAFERATADSVAVIEDHVLVPPDWAARLVAARRAGHEVAGGSVVNGATDRLVDRAAFLCEYGHMLEPQEPGPADWVTGNNVVYARNLLERFSDVIAEDRWENRLHEAVSEAGIPLVACPEVEVAHMMHYRSALEYAGQRYLYSRAYAGMRTAANGLPAKLVYSLGACALPPVLLMRVLRSAWRRAETRRDVALSLPLLALFVTAWAAGEAVGALMGPGDALQRVR